MPIVDVRDFTEVQNRLNDILNEGDTERRIRNIRTLFIETLDWQYADGLIPLHNARDGTLPSDARLIASRDGTSVVYIPLTNADTDRITAAAVNDAARSFNDTLSDDLLLLLTNRSADQFHIIRPDLTYVRPRLQRMVARRGEHHRTVVQQLANMWDDYGRNGKTVHEAMIAAFSVEPVTEHFFAEYRRIFTAAKKGIGGFSDDLEQHLFTQTLFNRLMFVYFISRKGWLNFGGDTDYLNALWRNYQSDALQSNFYISRIEPLFFAGLNNPQSRDLNKDNPVLYATIGDVEFLNGGLFEKGDLDRRDGVIVPDAAILPILRELFDRFNFTVMESTPYDMEVAVDPEMLGKVFEELVNERHESGAYYTPRPVVSFMCREALKGYLSSIETGLSDDAISEFVDSQNTDGISVADARKVAAALERVTVIDPACGSGAYLLGMMKELVDLQTTLFNAGADAKSIYDLKLEIIRRNLYGADIDNFAVNIAMLRLWLSLVIEYEGERPEPLPNLEFKIACGDSLLAPDPSPQNYGDLFGDFIRQFDLGRLKAEHMRTTEQADKDRLKAEIEDGRRQIREMLGDAAGDDVMDWRVEFAEVMGDGGFDVIIANPPYVVVKDSMLRSLYKEGVYGRMNLYGLFIQRSVQLLKEKGRLLFINPRTLLTDRYFTNLRKVIKQKSELRGVVLIEDRHNTFARVLQECIILHLARKSAPSRTYPVSTRSVRIPTELNDSRASHSVESGRVLLEEEYDGTFYIGTSEFEYQVFEKMRGFGRKLSTFGIKAETGKVQFSNYREFARDSKGQGSLRLLWAENVQRYGIREARQRKGKEWLSRKMTFNLRPNITGRGVMTQRTTANEQPRRIIATIVEPSLLGAPSVYSENGTNFISFDQLNEIEASPNLLLAALNSSIMEFIFRRLNSNVHVSAGEINKLPFPRMPNESTLREIDKFVTGLLELGGVDCDSSEIAQSITYEHRLDILIGALYGFSPSEVEKIQQALPSFESIYGVDPKPFSTLKGEESEEAISIARRGRRIFVEKIPDMVKKQKYGHFAVIDVYSEDYDIDESHLTATRRLTARRPGVITYTIRIGYPTAYKMGARL